MLDYKDLTTAQLKWLELAQELIPDIGDEITWAQLHEIHNHYLTLRSDKKYKVGFPNWLIRHNLKSRGTYHFPSLGNDNIDDVELTPLEKQFREEIGKYGLVIER